MKWGISAVLKHCFFLFQKNLPSFLCMAIIWREVQLVAVEIRGWKANRGGWGYLSTALPWLHLVCLPASDRCASPSLCQSLAVSMRIQQFLAFQPLQGYERGDHERLIFASWSLEVQDQGYQSLYSHSSIWNTVQWHYWLVLYRASKSFYVVAAQ